MSTINQFLKSNVRVGSCYCVAPKPASREQTIGVNVVDSVINPVAHDRPAQIAGSIAIPEIGTRIARYHLHERVWAVIGWGLASLIGCRKVASDVT